MIIFLLFFLICHTFAKDFDVKDDVYYELYSNDQPLTHFHNLLTTNNDNNRSMPLAESPFDPKRPTRIFVHGYRSKRKNFIKYAEAYRSKGNYNFIVVNWLAGAKTYNYYKARNRVKAVSILSASDTRPCASLQYLFCSVENNCHFIVRSL